MWFQLDYTRLPEQTNIVETDATISLIGILLVLAIILIPITAIYFMFCVESKHQQKSKLNEADQELEKELKQLKNKKH